MISVVMPAYNAEKYIDSAIESILNQTFQEFELIVIDDGSSDNTLGIIKSYAEKDNRVKVLQSEHVGASQARNLAIARAQYEWIAMMDADDIALPERFEKQIKAARANPKVVAWGTYVYHMNSQGKTLSLNTLGPSTEQEFEWQRANGHVTSLFQPTALIKKDIILQLGGYVSGYEPAEDFELFARIADFGPILVIPEALVLYRVHSQSASMQKFFKQKLIGDYIINRYRRKLAGQTILSLDEYIKQQNEKPFLSSLRDRISILGMFYYRNAGLNIADKQYLKGIFYLAISCVLTPQYSAGRLWRQIIAPKLGKLQFKLAKLNSDLRKSEII